MRILIADDDPQFLRALRITLGARGYEVLLARDGQHALEMAIDHKPDIILLDLGMPRLDGVKVIEAVRGWSSAPILVISGRPRRWKLLTLGLTTTSPNHSRWMSCLPVSAF